MTVWMPAGRGGHLDAWVPAQADFGELPDELRALPRLNEFRPEAERVTLALEGQIAVLLEDYLRKTHARGAPDLILFLNGQNIAAVEELFKERYAEAQKRGTGFLAKLDGFCKVPLADWAQVIGEFDSTRMYTVFSVWQEWERRLREAA